MNRIEVSHVSKTFDTVQAIRDVSLVFEDNKIYGLLGRNGAGKTTLLNMITSRVLPTGGEITVDGEPAIENDRAMAKLFMMGENNYYPESMRVSHAYRWAGAFYPAFDQENARELAGQFGLDTGKKIRDLSTGYNSIFKLTVALSAGTPYVLLDEPVLGLDANHRELFYKTLLTQYERRPACYVLSTHLIDEAAGLIEDVVILRSGEIIANESCEGLLQRGCTVTGAAAAVENFVSGRAVIGEDTLGGMKSAHLLEQLDPATVPDGLEITRLDLQKLFIQLTGE